MAVLQGLHHRGSGNAGADTMSTATAPTRGPKGARANRQARQPRPPRSTRPARPTRQIRAGDPEEALAIASSAFGIIALVAVWMLVQMLGLGALSEQRSQHLLYAQFRSELAQATAPTGELDYQGKPLVVGAPVALLTIPRLKFEQVVVDGTSSGALLDGPGHLRTTPMPGQAGISVILGRATTYGAPFGQIASLHRGDPITVLNATGTVTYTVVDVRRAGDPIPAAPTGTKGGRLTLVSAQGGGGLLGGLRPRTAIYVDAETTKATPAGLVASGISDSEQPLGRDTGALPLLVLLLTALTALVWAVTVGRRRFRAVLVWTVASPVAIALAWAVTDQVMRLLPNLM